MKRKQRIHISLAVLAVVIVAVILFLFLKIYKGNLIPVSTELNQKSESFFKSISIDPTKGDTFVVIANNQYVTNTGKLILSSNKENNKFAFANNDRHLTYIRILEQPQEAKLSIGVGIGAGQNIAFTLTVPGTYRFGLKDNPSATYTLTVVEPTQ